MPGMRLVQIPLWVVVCAGCGGPATPTAPEPPSLSGQFSLSGRVVVNQTGAPIGGATIELTQSGTGTVTTDAGGRFTVPAIGAGIVQFSASAPEHLTYSSRLQLTAPRSGFVIELIHTSAPFHLGFYREFVRNAHEALVYGPTRPWTMAPSFYLRTIVDDTGEPVDDVILDGVRRVLVNSVPELTGGRLEVAEIATGPDPGVARTGWVNVRFVEDTSTSSASVGGNSGVMTLAYRPPGDGSDNPYGCPSWTVYVSEHEVTHTMGFWHTSQSGWEFFSQPGCPGNGRPELARHHAAVMYSRPPGNRDPDVDANTFAHQLLRVPGTGPIVECDAARIPGPQVTRR